MPPALGASPPTQTTDTVSRLTTNLACPPLSEPFCLGNSIGECRLIRLCCHKHTRAAAKHSGCQFPSDTHRALDKGVRFQTVLQIQYKRGNGGDGGTSPGGAVGFFLRHTHYCKHTNIPGRIFHTVLKNTPQIERANCPFPDRATAIFSSGPEEEGTRIPLLKAACLDMQLGGLRADAMAYGGMSPPID